MAVRPHSTFTRLSSLIQNPFVRAAFERAERDQGQAFAVSTAPLPTLNDGSAALRPGAFDIGSDVLADLVNAIRSAVVRMERQRLTFHQALHEVLEDVFARRLDPAADVRGATYDSDRQRADNTMRARALSLHQFGHLA